MVDWHSRVGSGGTKPTAIAGVAGVAAVYGVVYMRGLSGRESPYAAMAELSIGNPRSTFMALPALSDPLAILP